ncbi:MAG: sugar phosphate isomerase/epimerase [Bacteroidales bacterium]|jgi:sugar phosphate isomerase/epimerase|nr:sugar phosphate isomerase/epimerase [Bacteroidales bacterium]
MERRHFIQLAAAGIPAAFFPFDKAIARSAPSLPPKVKISLNAYSFNKPLLAGEMTIDDMLDFAAKTGFEGVDLTGYYFPGYPAVPSDEYIYHVKQHAFKLGLEICGSGVRNDFTYPDAAKLATEKKHVKDWIEVASKLGAQTLRIFAGKDVPDGYTWDQTADRIAADVRECAEHARRHGVMLALQNHNDFLKTAAQVQNIFKRINSEWAGLMLDIGCYRGADPFAEIAQTVPLAITWQVKEEMYINNKPVKTDLDRLKKIIDASAYRGYLPVETLGEGDPKQKITRMYREVKKRFG